MMGFVRFNVLVLTFLASGAFAQPVTHHYTVTVDYSLRWMTVEARFAEPVKLVSARSRDARRFIDDVRGCSDEERIRMRGRRMQLPEDGVRCLNYTVDLDDAADEYRGARSLDDDNIVVSPAYWLWRPPLDGHAQLEVKFRLPENVSVSVPWQQLDGTRTRYLLRQSPESSRAPAVFGNLIYREIEVPGATLRVTLLKTENTMNVPEILDWVQAAATDISLAYGYFPNPSPQVVVVPVGLSWSSSPVPFGRVIRDGGETVELFVNTSESLQAFLGDWTATHEFSHMMVPYLDSDFRWISEGFAQYYQNILMARAGAYEEQEAWQKIYAGLKRGRESRPDLSPNAATSGRARSTRMKVYWSGAALAFLADVQLREQSGGKESIDTVLQEFQACCLPSEHEWTGPEFFARLDSFASQPVFMPLYRAHADTPGFPDTSVAFERLGLDVQDDKVRIRANAELDEIRRTITRMDMPVAQWRGQLATN